MSLEVERLVQPDVSVVVVNYNGGGDLGECLQALLAASPGWVEIVVVDNASTDGSAAIAEGVAAQCPMVRVLRSTVNRGYAGGVNFAWPHLRGRYVAVLNMDMVVLPGWLEPLVDFLDSHPTTAAVNPLIVLDADPSRINAAGQDVHVTGLGFNRRLGWPCRGLSGAPERVSGFQGGAVLLRRFAVESVGGWDESGFMYHEDVELSWLLQLAGWDIYCVPTAMVRHKYHLTMYPEKLFLLERNRGAMLVADLTPLSWGLLAPLLLLTEAMMWGYCLMRGGAFLRAKAAAYRWVAAQWPRLRARRSWIESVRRRSDWQILRRLRWGYAWDQFLTLGRERGRSCRQPAGGLPVSI